jgi:hypothetical protein
MTIANPAVNKVFNDLDQFRDYCRFEGKVFNEADLYKKDAAVWIAFQKYQGWLRAKARNGGKDFVQRDRRPNPRYNNTKG